MGVGLVGYIGVTDLDHGTATYFDSGEIGPRMVASCSIPIVFRFSTFRHP